MNVLILHSIFALMQKCKYSWVLFANSVLAKRNGQTCEGKVDTDEYVTGSEKTGFSRKSR